MYRQSNLVLEVLLIRAHVMMPFAFSFIKEKSKCEHFFGSVCFVAQFPAIVYKTNSRRRLKTAR